MDRQRELFAMSERLKSLDVQNDSQEYKSPLERIIKCIGDTAVKNMSFPSNISFNASKMWNFSCIITLRLQARNMDHP